MSDKELENAYDREFRQMLIEQQTEEATQKPLIEEKVIEPSELVLETADLPARCSEETDLDYPVETEVVSDNSSPNLQSVLNLINKSYLSELQDCVVVPFEKDVNLPNARWYNITKIVYEKGIFFADKMKMLYNSLHDVAKQVMMVVKNDCDGKIQLYIGARDAEGNDYTSGDTLDSALKSFVHGISFEHSDTKHFSNYKNPSVASVSGIASLPDDKKENFIQGLENLINSATDIPYTAYFIADSIDDNERLSLLSANEEIYSKLSSMKSIQQTISESQTASVTKGITESISKQVSRTITNGKNSSHSQGTANGTNESDSNGESDTSSFLFWSWGSNSSHTTGRFEQENETYQTGTNYSTADQSGETNQKGTNESETNGTQDTKSLMTTAENKVVSNILETLDDNCKRLKNSAQYGLWNCSAYFVSETDSSSKQLASIYKGSILGEKSGREMTAINVWKTDDERNYELMEYLDNFSHPLFKYYDQEVTAGSIVNSEELAIHFSLPQKHVPGIIVQERASFGRNVFDCNSKKDSRTIHLGNVQDLGRTESANVDLELESLSKHTFIAGTTGIGKSNTLYNILEQSVDKNVKFLVIEPAKGEYKHVFGNRKDVNVYGTNSKKMNLLRINPFEFPEDIDVNEHIGRLVEIFNACWPMYSAMPQVLKRSIENAYKSCGWDLDESESEYRLFPNLIDVTKALKDYINNSEYSAETKGDYIGALQTRLESLQGGLEGKMLCGVNSLRDEDLFNENVIVDLSSVNTESKSLLMGLLVMKLNEFRISENKGMNLPLRHLTVLEEAHHLLKNCSTQQNQESSNLQGKSVEALVNSISEMRTYGEGFIIADQSPALLDRSVIRNTNTKIIMALPDKDDCEVAGKSINLNDDQIAEISRQKVGEAIVYQNAWEEAVQCKVDEFKGAGGTFKFVKTNVAPKVSEEAVLEFLLNGRLINGLENIIKNLKISTSAKIKLVELLKGNRSLFEDKNFPKLAKVIFEIVSLKESIWDLKTINQKECDNFMTDFIQREFPSISEKEYRKLKQSILRGFSEKGGKERQIYSQWLNNEMQ